MGTTLTGTKKGNNIHGDINFNNNTLFVSSSGNIGIGTTAPAYKLTVDGNIQLPNGGFIYGQSTGNYLKLDNATYVELGYSSTTAVRADGSAVTIRGTAGAAKMTVKSSGEVGIGTTSPLAKLHVEGTGALLDLANNTSGNTYLRFKDGTSNKFALRHMISAGYLGVYDYNEGSDTLVITGSNVGIGTTSPSDKLQVEGNIRLQNSGRVYLWQNNSNNYIDYANWIASTGNSQVIQNTGAGGITFKTLTTARMFISSSGNIGIGTVDPRLRVHVDGDARIENLLLGDSGVTNTPAAPLHIKTSGTNARLRIEDSDSTNTYYDFYVNQGAGLYINEGATNRLFISESGNVGIGTSSPSAKLQLSDSSYVDLLGLTRAGANTANLRVGNLGSGDIALDVRLPTTDSRLAVRGAMSVGSGYADSANTGIANGLVVQGNVGIGTNSPSSSLHVEGNVQIGSNRLKLGADNADSYIQHNGSNLITHFQSNWGGDFKFRAADTGGTQYDILFIEGSNQRVGIGTTAPAEKLEVYSGNIKLNDGSRTLIIGEEGSSSHQIKSSGYLVVDATSGIQINKTTNGNVSILNGSVGIGTSTPADSLHISQSNPGIRLSDSTVGREVDFRQVGNQFIIRDVANNASFINANLSNNPVTVESSGIWTFKKDTTIEGDLTVDGIVTAQEFHTEFVSASIVYQSGSTKFGDTSDDVHSFTGSLEVLGAINRPFSVTDGRAFHQGESGGWRLEYGFKGSSGTDRGGFGAQGGNDTVTYYYIGSTQTDPTLAATPGGNVGIGTTSPSGKLEVQTGYIISSGSGAADLGFVLDRAGLDTYQIRHLDGGLTIYNATDSRKEMTFLGDGNVGIGTANPATKLTVNGGNIRRTHDANNYSQMGAGGSGGFINGYSGNTEKFIIRSYASAGVQAFFTAGNIGIGTTTPRAKLDIQDSTHGTLMLSRPSETGYAMISGSSGLGFEFKTYDAGEVMAMKIANDGKVGIGTTSPSASLSIGDGTTANVNVYLNKKDNNTAGYYVVNEGNPSGRTAFIRQTSGEDAEVGTSSTNNLSFLTNDTVRVHIDGDNNNGNVGIGTTTPSAKFHVFSDTHSDFLDNGILLDVSSSDEGEPAIAFRNQSDMGSNYWITGINNGGQNLDFAYGTAFTSANTKVRFTSDGKVGIGTASPNAGLEVANAENSTLRLTRSSNTSNYLQLQGGSSGAIYNINTSGTQDHIFQTGGNEKMRLTSAGDLGIGTSAPTLGKLHVVQSSDAVTEGITVEETSGGNTMRLWMDGSTRKINAGGSNTMIEFDTSKVAFPIGKVGIGTNTPEYKLDIQGDSPILRIADDNTVNSPSASAIWMGENGFSEVRGAGIVYDGAANSISLVTSDNGSLTDSNPFNASKRLTVLESNGNVGIGTDSPNQKLHVVGDVNIEGLNPTIYLTDTNGADWNIDLEDNHLRFKVDSTEYIRFQNGGNVGIGTTSPSEKLEVAGKAIVRRTGTATAHADTDLFVTDATAAGSTAQIEILGGNAGNSMLYFSDPDSYSQGAIQYLHSTDNMNIRVNGSTAMTIDSSRNVGIGTTNPPHKVSSKVSADGNYAYYAANSLGSNRGGIYIDSSGNTELILRTGVGHTASIKASGSSYFNGGNVGIGTTSPSYKLTVGDSSGGDGTTAGIAGFYGQHASSPGLLQINYDTDGSGETSVKFGGNGVVTGRGGIFNFNTSGKDISFAVNNEGNANVSNAALYISSSGDAIFQNNVGIGTTSPSSRLHVSGAADVLLIEGSGSTANTSIFAIDGNNGRLFEVSDDLSDSLFSVNTIAGLPVMEVFSDNRVTMGAFNQNDLVISGSRVGIGTDSPSAKLDVNGNIYPTTDNTNSLGLLQYKEWSYVATRKITGNNNRMVLELSGDTVILRDHSTVGDGVQIKNQGNVVAQFGDAAGSGKVGIGTTSPDSLLEIYSDSTTDFLKLTSGNSTANPIKLIFEKSATEQGIIEYNRNGDLEIYNSDNDGGVMLNGRNSEAGDLYVADGGNVGIGTTSPSEKLQVNGNVAISGSNATLQLREGSAELYKLTAGGTSLDMTVDSTNAISIYQNGSVGIGTTSPSTKLHVATSTSGGDPSVIIQDNVRGQTGTLNYVSFTEAAGNSQAKFGFQSTLNGTFTFANLIGDVDITSTGQIRAIASSNFIVQTAGSAHFIVNNLGDVGIGNTSPTEKLEVTGNIKATRVVSDILRDTNDNSHLQTTVTNASNTATVVGNSATANTLTLGVKSTGNVVVPSGSVGIGTTSPSHTLDVAQVADNQGIKLSGYDDQSGRSYSQYVDQNGHISLVASSGANLNYTVQSGHFNVNLNTSTKDFRVKDSGGSTVLNVTGDSKVGIGLTAPAETLHLSGSMRIDGAGTGTVQEQPGSPDTAYTNSSETNFYMGAPDRYLKIVLDGTTYLIPAYTPA